MSAVVVVRWCTDKLVGAVVHDSSGISDVRWTADEGWACSSCPDCWTCAHVLAVRQHVERREVG